MSKTSYTCTGCMPIDKSIVDTYIAMLTALDIKQGPKGDKGDKGDTGDTGERGPKGVESVTATVDGTTGEPSVTTSYDVATGALGLAFSGIKGDKGEKGDQGNTGSSVDYPYELVNNVTTDDATKGLSAAQGVALDGKISQLGQDIAEVGLKEKNASGDLQISDENGFAIVQIKNGHIFTKHFNSEKTNKTEKTENVDLALCDNNGVSIFSVRNGFPYTKNFDGRRLAELASLVDDSNLYETIIVNIADYGNNLLNVYGNIAPSPNKHYVILVPEGTYNVNQWFTQAAIDAGEAAQGSGFRGIELMNYTKIVGLGRKDKVVFQWLNEGSPYTYISVFNTNEYNELENITVKAKNIRYAVHDDIWNGKDRFLRVKNCIFYVEGETTRAWGGGCNGGYDAVFENCIFEMKHYAPFDNYPQSSYIEPFCLHDNHYNTRGNSRLFLKNCRFISPYTDYVWDYTDSWQAVTYDSTKPLYNPDKVDYAVDNIVNMENDTTHSYKCLYANTQVPPYIIGRPCINIGFGAEGATGVLNITVEGCYTSTYIGVSPKLTRLMGFGNKLTKGAVLNGESTDSKYLIINLI